jgi:uncharacterized protein YutE (UPF0331/DUF86 family)
MNSGNGGRRRAGREALDDLRLYRESIPYERFLADRHERRKVLHAILIAVQACVDEALGLCRELGIEHDGTYRGAFRSLAQGGSLPAEWLPGLESWASYRNIVAHFYPVLDLERLYRSMGEVDVLERFLGWAEARRRGA